MRWWRALLRWLGLGGAAEAPSAAALLETMRAEAGSEDPEWRRLRARLATLVFSEADQQRLWRRAHRGVSSAPRLLSGIRLPTDEERRLLRELIEELERGR